MKQSMKLLFAALAVASSAICADVRDTNKTFITLRDLRNRSMQMTTFSTLSTPENPDRLGGAVQATGFYSGGVKSSKLGGTFLLDGANSITFANSATSPQQESRGYVFNIGPSATGTVTLKPSVNSYGVLLKYNQQLDGLAEGLWLSVNAPIANVSTNLNASFSSTSSACAGLTIPQYLAGTSGTYQNALKYSKIDGISHQRTELADVEVQLGWNFINSERHQVGLNIGALFPTGAKATGEYLFEPMVGSVHWALGAGANANVTLWSNESSAIRFIATADYRYLLQDTETRCLETVIGGTPEFGRYGLATTFGATANTLLTPAANYLNRDINVTPGNQFDTNAMFEYTNGGFSLDLGYNLFYKDAETGKLKQAWTDNSIGFIQPTAFVPSAAALAHAGGTTAQGLESINNAEEAAASGISAGHRIDLPASLSHSAITHKVFAGMGYTAAEWDYPVMVAVGGHYEFASNARTASENFGVCGKVGIAF